MGGQNKLTAFIISRSTVLTVAYATVLHLSSECIVAKRCVLKQKLLLTAFRKSYMRNRLVPKRMTVTFV